MITGVSHIGIAVSDLDSAVEAYRSLGLECSGTEIVEEQKVKVAFIEAGATRIELLQTTDPEGPIGKHIARRGEGLHHLALEVTDLANKLAELEQAGIKLVDRTPRKGAHGMNIAFLHPKAISGTLLELCETAQISAEEQ